MNLQPIGLAALLALAACHAAPPSPRAADDARASPASTTAVRPAAAVATDVVAIKAVEAQWQSDIAARNVDAIVGHYADDAALIIPESAPRIGIAAIRDGLPDAVRDPGFSMTAQNVQTRIAASGDLAYTRGTIRQSTSGKDGAPQVQVSNYLTVFRKQADGKWLAVEDMTSPG